MCCFAGFEKPLQNNSVQKQSEWCRTDYRLFYKPLCPNHWKQLKKNDSWKIHWLFLPNYSYFFHFTLEQKFCFHTFSQFSVNTAIFVDCCAVIWMISPHWQSIIVVSSILARPSSAVDFVWLTNSLLFRQFLTRVMYSIDQALCQRFTMMKSHCESKPALWLFETVY